MKAIDRLYLKIFLRTGLPFATLMSAWDYYDGMEFSIFKFLFMFFFFGFFMSISTVQNYIDAFEKNGITNITKDHLKVKQDKIVESHKSPEEIIQLLNAHPLFTKIYYDERSSIIKGKSKFNLRSWGNKISIEKLNNHKGALAFCYNISSKPLIPTTIFDYGTNFENIQEIEKILSSSYIS